MPVWSCCLLIIVISVPIGVCGKPRDLSLVLTNDGGMALKWSPPESIPGHTLGVTGYSVWKYNKKRPDKGEVLVCNITDGSCFLKFSVSVAMNMSAGLCFSVQAVRNYHEGPKESLKIMDISTDDKEVTSLEYVTMDCNKMEPALFTVERSVTCVDRVKNEENDAEADAGKFIMS